MFPLRNRIRLIIAALILIPILLYWGYSGTPQEASNDITQLTGRIDYYVDNAHTREWDEAGMLKRTITATKIEHDPQAEVNYLTYPKSISFRSDRSQVQITSEKGVALDDNSRTDLAGNVIVHDNPTSASSVKLVTERLSIYPKDDFAETDQPVTISSASGNLKGTGMDLHLEKQVLNLHSNVKGIYHEVD